MNAAIHQKESWRPALLVGFVAVVAIFGGSSRYDAAQLALLRPLAALFLIPALYFLTFESLRTAKTLLLLLGLCAVWTALQLVPLPPALWQSLPGREAIAELDQLVGLDGAWRPISLVPFRGWNALAAMIVPVAAILIALAVRADQRMIMLAIAGLALVDGALGLMQVAMGPTSFLYFYAKTNAGAPVGIFANENHSAMFSALGMITIAYLAGTSRAARDAVLLKIAFAPAFILALLSIFAGGSRFGFVLAIFALLVAAYLAFTVIQQNQPKRSESKDDAAWLVKRPRLLALLFACLCLGLSGTFYAAERMPGLQDLFSENVMEGLRVQIWSVLEGMIGIHWLVGTGFGSFEEAFHIYEPTQLIRGAYLNQAHNDWAQLVIEGGVPALALVLALGAHIASRLKVVLSRGNGSLRELVFWLSAIIIISAASIVDYPLRTPVFQMAVALLLVGLLVGIPQRAKSLAKSKRPKGSQPSDSRRSHGA